MAVIITVKLLGTLSATLVAYGVYKLSSVIFAELTSPTRDLPGPKNTSLVYGNVKEALEDVWCYPCFKFFLLTPALQESVFHERWPREHGRVFRFRGLLNVRTITLLYSFPSDQHPLDEPPVYRGYQGVESHSDE